MSAEKTAEEKQKRRFWQRGSSADDTAESAEDAKGLTASKGRATPGRRASGEAASSNFITRSFGGVFEYFAGVRSELQKVTWPDREETRRLTILVIVVTIVASIVLGLISLGFTELFRFGLDSPLIFLAFFVIVAVAGFVLYRRRADNDVSSY